MENHDAPHPADAEARALPGAPAGHPAPRQAPGEAQADPEGGPPGPEVGAEVEPPPPRAPATLVTVFQTVHRGEGGAATGPPTRRAVRVLDSDDPPYVRPSLPVRGEWAPIDLGWLDGRPLAHLEVYCEPVRRSRIPTRAERADDYGRYVEVGLALPAGRVEPLAVVRPGQAPLSLEPARANLLRLRAPSGDARVAVHAFPA